MPRNNEIKNKVDNFVFGQYFNLPNPGLRSYFDKVRVGQPDEYRTTFAKGSSLQKVLAEWKPTVDSLSDTWPTLLDFENDLAKKVGPLSIMKPLDERIEDIDSYYESILLDSKPIDHSAIAAVLKEWSNVRGLHLRSQRDTVALMKKSTSSGSPYFTKRRTVTSKTTPCKVWQEDNLTWQKLVGETWRACATLGWRGQEGGPTDEDVKQRVIWMFPYAVNICELQVYQPLIEASQRFSLVPAWIGLDEVDRRITKLFDTKAPNDLVVCTDFSKFDQHFNADLQNAGREILEGILTPVSTSVAWLDQVYPIKYAIPLAFDYGHVRYGRHGMASGSGGTNADETLVHRALQYEAAQKSGKRLNPNSQCLGDDGVLSYPGITAEDVMRSYTSHGLEMNPDKQYVSTQDCTYLRRWHHRNYRVDGVCVGVYSTYRALGRLCEQERYYDPEVWGPKMVALRQLSILENVKYHPLREQFADFCMARDKYYLGLTIPGFLRNIEKEAQAAIDLMPDFLGYTQSLGKTNPSRGISDWWIVRYLKSK